MAAFSVQLSWQDGAGRKAVQRIHVPSGLTIAQIETWFDAMIAELDPVTDCVLVGASVSVELSIPGGLKASAAADSKVENGALFSFLCAGNYYTRTRLPAIKDTMMVDNSTAVDTSDEDVAAWLTLMTTGDGTVAPCDSREADITSLVSAKFSAQSTRQD
jgi:hypothetical protein